MRFEDSIFTFCNMIKLSEFRVLAEARLRRIVRLCLLAICAVDKTNSFQNFPDVHMRDGHPWGCDNGAKPFHRFFFGSYANLTNSKHCKCYAAFVLPQNGRRPRSGEAWCNWYFAGNERPCSISNGVAASHL